MEVLIALAVVALIVGIVVILSNRSRPGGGSGTGGRPNGDGPTHHN